MKITVPTYRPTAVCSLSTAHNSLAAMHAFSSKERDVETGLSYFGARYYSSDLSIWLSVDPMASKYPSLSPYVYCANNPIKLVDPNGEEIGDFYNHKGRYKGTDNNNDGKIYIINTTSPIKTKKDLSKALANNSAYKNCMEIDASKVNRKKMVEIVSQDNGKGGTSENNNREYGGTYDRNGNIVELPPGKPGNPKEDNAKLEFDGSAVFHGHASGSYTENAIDIFDPYAFGTISNNANVKDYFWDQAPSDVDINNADETTHYVFGRRDGMVYIYNNTGLKSIMKMETFIHIND